MGLVTKIASLSGGATASDYHYPELGKEQRIGVLKIDWVVNAVGAGATISVNTFGLLRADDIASTLIDPDGNKITFTETDFGSPSGVGTYSVITEVLLTPFMQIQAINSNDASNVVNAYLQEPV